MHYVLDGYNIIHKSPVFSRFLSRSLEEARRALIGFCKTLLQTRGDVAKITVIFDGASDIFSGEESAERIEILYTMTGEDADDRIIDYIHKTHPRQAAVVSDDNYVCNNARALKAKSVSVADFLGLQARVTASKSTVRRHPESFAAKKISPQAEKDITQAYADYLGLKP